MTIISERQSSQVGFAHALSLNLTITDVVAEAIKICPCFQGGTPWLKLNGPVVWQVRNTHEQWWTLPVYWWVTENHHILSHREERAMTKGKENPWRRLHSVVSVLVVSWETIILPRKKPSGDGMSYCPLTFTVSISGRKQVSCTQKFKSLFFSVMTITFIKCHLSL